MHQGATARVAVSAENLITLIRGKNRLTLADHNRAQV
jgi:hypothetical protein